MSLPAELAAAVGRLADARSAAARALATFIDADAFAKRAGKELDDARARERVEHDRFLAAVDDALERLHDGAVA